MALSSNLMALGKSSMMAAGAMAAFPKVVKEASSFAIGQQKELVQFSGQVAASMASLDAARFSLQQEKAIATEESTAQLIASQIRLERAMAPLSNELSKLTSALMTELAAAITPLIKAINRALNIDVKPPEDRLMPVPEQVMRDIANKPRTPLPPLP